MAGCACISQEEYDETYGHNLGPDCIPDSGDEPDDRCPPGRFFDQDICQCASLIQCFNICAPPFSIKDPVNGCECISQLEYDERYSHNLGPDCIADSGDEPDDQCLPGNVFDQDICQCVTLFECRNICSEPTPIKDPVNGCECISQEEYDDRYSHNLGPDCIADSGDEEPIIAYAELDNDRIGIFGRIRFKELPNGKTKVIARVYGLRDGVNYELNIHEYGDIRHSC